MEDEEVKVAILETRLENFETLVARLDSAIEKIAEVNNNVSRMLAVHEQTNYEARRNRRNTV